MHPRTWGNRYSNVKVKSGVKNTSLWNDISNWKFVEIWRICNLFSEVGQVFAKEGTAEVVCFQGFLLKTPSHKNLTVYKSSHSQATPKLGLCFFKPKPTFLGLSTSIKRIFLQGQSFCQYHELSFPIMSCSHGPLWMLVNWCQVLGLFLKLCRNPSQNVVWSVIQGEHCHYREQLPDHAGCTAPSS